MPTLTLKKLTTTSFQGIDASRPSVIDFTEYANNLRIAMASGDMGEGKTSWLHSILYGFGQKFDFKLDNLVNLKDGTLNVYNEFEVDGKKYRVKATATKKSNKFLFEKLWKDIDNPEAPGKWIPEGGKEELKKIIGNVAVDPMFLKTEKGPDQVEWLYSVLNIPENVKTKEISLKAELTKYTKSYTATNSLYNEIKSALNQDDMYNNWEQSEYKYKEEKNVLSVKGSLDEADKKRLQFSNAKNSLDNLTVQLNNKTQQISDLEAKLSLLKNEVETLNTRVLEGQKYVSENESLIQDGYDKAYTDFTEINEYTIKRNHWISIVQKKNEMDQAETLVQDLDVKKQDTRMQIQELVKTILPPIEGLEVETESHIEGGRAIGIYIDGKTPAQLSESELFDFYFQVCISQGVNMVFVENLSSFGTKTIETLNKLAQKGVYVFGTMMDRREKGFKVELIEELV